MVELNSRRKRDEKMPQLLRTVYMAWHKLKRIADLCKLSKKKKERKRKPKLANFISYYIFMVFEISIDDTCLLKHRMR